MIGFLMVLISLIVIPKVGAMSKDELLNKIKAGYTINGETVKVDSSYVTMAERYLNNNNISASDADYIAKKIDAGIAILQANNVTDPNKLSSSAKNEIKAVASDISNSTSVKVTIDKTNGLTVYNTDGTVFAAVEKDPLKYTDSTLYVAISLISLLVCGLFLYKKAKNAK